MHASRSDTVVHLWNPERAGFTSIEFSFPGAKECLPQTVYEQIKAMLADEPNDPDVCAYMLAIKEYASSGDERGRRTLLSRTDSDRRRNTRPLTTRRAARCSVSTASPRPALFLSRAFPRRRSKAQMPMRREKCPWTPLPAKSGVIVSAYPAGSLRSAAGLRKMCAQLVVECIACYLEREKVRSGGERKMAEQKLILIVDDDYELSDGIRAVLENLGHKVIQVARDGQRLGSEHDL